MIIAGWLVSSVSVAPETTRDTYGKPAYGTRRSVKCRIQPQARYVTNARGEDARSSWRIYCEDPIGLSERVWLPGTNTSVDEGSYLPLAITISNDRGNSRHLYAVDL